MASAIDFDSGAFRDRARQRKVGDHRVLGARSGQIADGNVAIVSATGRVTQKVPSSFPTTETVSFRPDLAAMGDLPPPK